MVYRYAPRRAGVYEPAVFKVYPDMSGRRAVAGSCRFEKDEIAFAQVTPFDGRAVFT
jgi:hypothetical protein